MYYQGRDGGKPPSLHYTPLKQEGSKTPYLCLCVLTQHYTPLKQEGSKTDLLSSIFSSTHYTPLKQEGSKTVFDSIYAKSQHYTPLKHETPPENAKKPLSAQTCADRGFSCSLYTI